MYIYFFLLQAIIFLNFSSAFAMDSTIFSFPNEFDPKSLVLEKKHPKTGIVELVLQNGMKVILKSTDFEKDEIILKLAAKGGFFHLNSAQRASGELASAFAWESGIGNLTSDQISVLLYEHSIDFNLKILPFSRSIEGSASESGLETFFQLINLIFTQPKFNEAAFKTVVEQAKEGIRQRVQNLDIKLEDELRQINTQNFPILKPLTLADLEKADYNTAKLFFEQCYSRPSDFVLVIVGNFDQNALKHLLLRYLATIESKEVKTMTEKDLLTPLEIPRLFPKGISSKAVTVESRSDCISRLVFPLSINVDEIKIAHLEITCKLIETRLRKVIRENLKLTYGVDVAFEFPFYPYLDHPWMTIQFRCEPKLLALLPQMILAELKDFQKNGPSTAELEKALSAREKSHESWFKDNYFWAVACSNYYLWNWDLDRIILYDDKGENAKLRDIQSIFRDSLFLENYSIFSVKP